MYHSTTHWDRGLEVIAVATEQSHGVQTPQYVLLTSRKMSTKLCLCRAGSSGMPKELDFLGLKRLQLVVS